jgi:hypothetical protein
MNIKEFSQPTILTGKQYGTTVTIELDHSDTSIDEVMDGFLTIVKGLGYLDTTINQWIKDKSMDIYEDEYDIMKDSLADDWFDEDGNEYGDDTIDWATADEQRMDIIGQNGNDGLHYDKEGVDELLKRYNEPETQKRLNILRDAELGIKDGYRATDEDIEECELNERQLKDYKGVYVEKPHFDWDGEDYQGQFKEWETETPTDENEFDDYGQRIETPKPFSLNKKKTNTKVTPNKLDKTKITKGKIKDLKK